MSDFLISLGKRYNGQALLKLLQKPYGSRTPKGDFADLSWSSAAVLEEHYGRIRNVVKGQSAIFAWVGDLVTDMTEDFIRQFTERLYSLQRQKNEQSPQSYSLFEKLNGAFAIFLANESGICIISDPMSFTSVFIGKSKDGQIVSIGTHSDLVAAITDNYFNPDLVSLAEFVNTGNCTFAGTMHKNVRQMRPGTVLTLLVAENHHIVENYFTYWQPPKEQIDNSDESELVEQLRSVIVSAVKSRCNHEKVAVLLSGGLDSRAIIASVPEAVNCIAVTFCDQPNRETKTARRVAECYGRKWIQFARSSEFLAETITDIVKLTGCEFEWVNAHNIGFFNELDSLGIDIFLSGQQCDAYLKALFVPDLRPTRRLRGLLSTRYDKTDFDFADNLSCFCRQLFTDHIIEQILKRRNDFYTKNHNNQRSSIEWLNIYPFSQDREGAYWAADRRVLPLSLVAADRHVLDFAFACPVELKLGGKIFLKTSLRIYGSGAKIPCANDGVSPDSGRIKRFSQLLARKFQNRTAWTLEKLRKKHKVQDSWSDYQTYWQRSKRLAELINDYSANLKQLDSSVFRQNTVDLLRRRTIHFSHGFRLLQLAIWLDLVNEYRKLADQLRCLAAFGNGKR